MARTLWGTLFLVGCALLAASQEAVTPVEVPAAEFQNFLIKRVAPVYPPLARQARIQGTVFLKVIVTKAGEVRSVEVVSGHPMLVPSAVEAVKQWRYTPYQKNGEPVEVTTTVQVDFRIAGSPAESAAGSRSEDSATPPQSGGIVGAVDAATTPLGPPPPRVRISSAVAGGLLVKKVAPRYPNDARGQGIEGTVLLKLNIDKEGNVYKTELISGHPTLAPAAIEAVQQWKYRPYLLNGAPVEVETQAQINFQLRR